MATPEQFIERLMVHFSKRHNDEHAEQVWFSDMVKAIRGYDPKVLDMAGDMLIEERAEIRFPLPAEIRDYCTKACKRLYPTQRHAEDKSDDLPAPSEEQRERAQALVEAAKQAIAYKQIPEAKLPSFPDVTRPTFEAMQRNSPNQGLHMTRHGLTERSKAMTGEREEDAA